MSITLHVSLLSGRGVSLDTGLDVDVENFKQQAQRALSVGKGRLVHVCGSVLDGARTIREFGLQNDDVLNLQMQPVKLLANQCNGFMCPEAFDAILGDASVATWGDPGFGGDCSAVQDQLKNVQQIQASSGAFAAILDDGSVVTWGDPGSGGDSNAVQDQLKNVQQIQASHLAFAAVLADGSVVAWGNPGFGGDSNAVQDQLKNVQQIHASYGALQPSLLMDQW